MSAPSKTKKIDEFFTKQTHPNAVLQFVVSIPNIELPLIDFSFDSNENDKMNTSI